MPFALCLLFELLFIITQLPNDLMTGLLLTLCSMRYALCDLLLGGPTFLWMTPVNSVRAVAQSPLFKSLGY
jgi:hypothetical protein